MKPNKCLMLKVIFLLLIINKSICQIEQSFSEQPTNTSALFGTEALFKCTVANQQGEVTWCKETFCTFGRNRNFTDKRHSLIGDPSKGEHHLLIKNVTITDNVGYQCQVTASDKSPAKKSNIAYLTVLITPTVVKIIPNIRNDNNKVRITLKTNSTVECVSEDSNPPTDFNWYLDDERLSVKDDVYEIARKSVERTANKLYKTTGKIIIKPDQDSKWNGKTLKCEAYNEASQKIQQTNNSDSKRILLFYGPTTSIKKTSPGDHIIDQFSQFECVADARPLISNYKWFIDSKTLSSGPGERFFTLKIDNSMHKKFLRCDASNDFLNQTASYLLDISYAPKFKNQLPSHLMVPLEETLTLTCDVDANPAPVIVWKLNGVTKYSFQNFTINAMRLEDYGTYTCEASLKDFPMVISSVKVVQPGPPVIVNEPVQFAYYGHVANVECFIETEPRVEYISWYKENKMIDLSMSKEKYQIRKLEIPQKGTKFILSVMDVIQQDFGNYTCNATNKYGSSSAQISLEPKSNTMDNFVVMASIILVIIIIMIIISICGYKFYKKKNKKRKYYRKKRRMLTRDYNHYPMNSMNAIDQPLYPYYHTPYQNNYYDDNLYNIYGPSYINQDNSNDINQYPPYTSIDPYNYPYNNVANDDEIMMNVYQEPPNSIYYQSNPLYPLYSSSTSKLSTDV